MTMVRSSAVSSRTSDRDAVAPEAANLGVAGRRPTKSGHWQVDDENMEQFTIMPDNRLPEPERIAGNHIARSSDP